jgi:hypothetical protein
LINFNAALIKDGITRIVIGWKKNLSQSRKDAKKTTVATGFGALSVGGRRPR